MPGKSSDRYEKAPAEGKYYDPKGYLLLKQFRRWAKIVTFLLSVVLFITVIAAITEEKPGPFFAVFFSFVVIMGFVGITYDHKLAAHKDKVLNGKIRQRKILQESLMASNNSSFDASRTVDERIES